MERGTVSGKKLVVGLVLVLLAGLAAYPFVRHEVLAAQSRERAVELARERARAASRSGSIAP